jgi:chemotaxis protein MotB
MASGKSIRPIIVIKKKVAGGGGHGGAWKVAYADFMTAMMSLFIVLWLLNTTPQIKKAVAGYFNDPLSGGKETGTKALGMGESVSIDQKNVANLKEQIEKAMLKQTDLNKLSKQVEISVTGEGLKIDLIEEAGGTFFETGSPKLSDNGVKLLDVISGQLKDLPNHLLIEGYTDAQPYSSDNGYTNWELSSDRANSARRVLQQGGVLEDHISQVRGYADQSLRVPSNPLDPSNRRVSLIVKWVEASSSAVGAALPTATGSASIATPDAAAKLPVGALVPQSGATNTPSPNPSSAGAAKSPPKPASGNSVAAKPSWSERFKALVPGSKKQS